MPTTSLISSIILTEDKLLADKPLYDSQGQEDSG
jgi:hypothetical protein